jgi:hypothetical protein
VSSANNGIDREAVTEENNYQLNDDDDEDEEEGWEGEGEWTNEGEDNEGDVKDESTAYLEFLNEEVSRFTQPLNSS